MDRVTALAFAAALAITLAIAGVVQAKTPKGGDPETYVPSREDRVEKTAEEWKQELSAEEFRILREKGTERAFTGDYHDDHEPGVYTCGGCGLELFHSEAKFDSGTGWPSYYKPIAEDRIDELSDTKFGMLRTEVLCARCGGHLGHVFPDGPPPTGLRYCINGNALDKQPLASTEPAAH